MGKWNDMLKRHHKNASQNVGNSIKETIQFLQQINSIFQRGEGCYRGFKGYTNQM